MSKPAEKFILLRNGLAQIDQNTLEIREILGKNEANQRRKEKIKSKLKKNKNSLSQLLESTFSEIEQNVDITILINDQRQKLEEKINIKQKELTAIKKEISNLKGQLGADEETLEKVIQKNRKSNSIKLSLINITFWLLLLAVLNWDLDSDSHWLFMIFQMLVCSGVCYILIVINTIQFAISDQEKVTMAKTDESDRLYVNASMTKNQIKNKNQSTNMRRKNLVNWKSKLLGLENAKKTYGSITSSQARLDSLEQEESANALKVLELEKENAEIWTSISDLIPSEFQ